MRKIGMYQGTVCYDCTHEEWLNCHRIGTAGKLIFIIQGTGTMVQQNRIIGYYDGKTVRDVYDSKVYYQEPKKVVEYSVTTATAQNSKWDEKFIEEVKQTSQVAEAQEIRFSDYSKVVDEFFLNLK